MSKLSNKVKELIEDYRNAAIQHYQSELIRCIENSNAHNTNGTGKAKFKECEKALEKYIAKLEKHKTARGVSDKAEQLIDSHASAARKLKQLPTHKRGVLDLVAADAYKKTRKSLKSYIAKLEKTVRKLESQLNGN